MKFNFKSLLSAMGLISAMVVSAANEPTFSSADSPVWHQVKFTTGGHVLKDNGVGKLITADAGGANALRWQLIGTPSDFKMKSAAGRYVGFSGDRFTAVSNESDAVSLSIKDLGECWEIRRNANSAGKAMNQWGGTSVGVELGEWNSADNNNKLNFISTAMPEFATADQADPEWYYIQFCNNKAVVTSQGVGNKVKREASVNPVPSKLWKLVGNASNFQIVNKNGEYLKPQGSGDDARLYASDDPYDKGFSLRETPSTAYWPALEIKPNGYNGYFNLWQGANAAHQEIGFWTGGETETGNALQFMTMADLPAEEYAYEGSTTYRPEHKLSLWYTRPGTTATYSIGSHPQKWMDLGLPIGNGQLGATLLGGVMQEDISVNEKTLWTGKKEDNGSNYGCYQNFGSLKINSLEEEGFGWEDNGVKNYWRNLDLTDATSNVSYENAAGTVFTRRFLASYPDNVVAALLSASTPGAINVKFTEVPGMAAGYIKSPVTYNADGTITYGGKFETVSFASCIKIVPTGPNATMTADATGITVKGADQIFVVIAAGTDYDLHASNFTSNTDALTGNVAACAANAAAKGWDAVLADHVADYQAIFNRVDFDLTGSVNDKPTDELITYYQNTTKSNVNADDNNVRFLEQLYFHYGRYLHIGSSRGVDVPNNLQGIWSGFTAAAPYGGQIAPWNADIHNNINLQMCYWPAEPTNLSELHLPLLNYLISQATEHDTWQKLAKGAGQTKGWTFFTESNIFGGSGSFMHNYTIANAWCCSHLFQHYDYTLDKDFLKRAFPTIWSTCEFWMERLVKGADGSWEAPKEYSPEHGPGSENATAHAQQILVDLFSNTLKAIDTLGLEACGISAADKAKLQAYYDNLDRGLASEEYTKVWNNNSLAKGTPILREWKYSAYNAGQDGHRHMSHLMCLYPYSQVEPGHPMFQPAVNSMILRGDGATGWSMGWKINLWARAQDGDHARKILRNALCSTHTNGSGVYNNLFDSHSPFQIDGNFGACSGITEMLLQSRNGGIYMLPALPSTWKQGEINGLKAAGDVTFGASWKNGRIATAKLVANQGGTLKIGNSDIEHLHVSLNGAEIDSPLITINTLTGTKTIDMADLKAGDTVEFTYDANYTNTNTRQDEGAIEAAQLTSGPVRVSNGKVIAPGAISIVAYDIQGREIASANGPMLLLPAAFQGVLLIKAVAAGGTVTSTKAIL
ncbi:MAG: glycoside hydrolase family 95 protein [Muribaculaceae bacterium]|nr:glycoside hydrolase family 95 protein [Muribaculaceae bacterium]